MSLTTCIFKSERSSKSDLCRLCRKSNSVYYNIFTSNIACKITVKEALHDLVDLQVAVGDGLPNTMCPLCLKKLTEFSVFKKICLESNTVLRKFSPRNCGRSIEGEGAADDKPRPSVETKESIQDIIDSSSHVTCSPQMTEIYIPVPDCLLPRNDELCHVKEENRDHLVEESYSMLHIPAGISTDVMDPLATDDVSDPVANKCSSVKEDQISEDEERHVHNDCTPGISSKLMREASPDHMDPVTNKCSSVKEDQIGDAEERSVHNDCTDGVSSKLMHEASSDQGDPGTNKYSSVTEDEISVGEEGYVVNDCTDCTSRKVIHQDSPDQPATGEDMMPVGSFTMAQKSSTQEIGVPAAEDLPIEATSTSYLPAEGSARNHSIDECIGPTALVTQNYSKTLATHVGVGRNLIGKDSEKCGALDTDEITCCSIPGGSQCNTKDIESLKRSGGGAAMTVPGDRGGCDAQNTMDSLRHIRIRRKDKSGSETVKGNNEEILNCLIANPCNSNRSNKNSYHCFDCRDWFSNENELTKHMKIHVVSRNFNAVAESSVGDMSLKPLLSGDNSRSCVATTSRALGGLKTKRLGPRQKGNVSMRETIGGKGDTKTVRRVTRSFTADEESTSQSLSPKSPCMRNPRNHVREKGRPYSCSVCAKSFPHKGHLTVHIRTHTGEKPFSCNQCELSFSTKGVLVNHVRTHTGERPYPCSICSKSFAHKGHLTVHIRTHTGEKPFSCNQCELSFSTKGVLVNHVRTHTGERPYPCSICSKSFAHKGHLTVHIRTHTGEKPFSCNQCELSFSTKGVLVNHVRTHTGERPYPCSICSKSFAHKGHLTVHIRTHTGEKPFSCNQCELSFSTKGVLVNHVRTHTGERPYPCSICSKSFAHKRDLAIHIRTHTGERPFSCNQCEKSFSSKSCLVNHVRKHTGEKPYPCTVCSKSFAQKAVLTVHIRTHTGERPFSCDICFKAFTQRGNLKDHMLRHRGEKPYACDVCSKSFARRDHLVNHIRTHTGERPFTCNECEKSFSKKYILVRHIRTHTGEKPYSYNE